MTIRLRSRKKDLANNFSFCSLQPLPQQPIVMLKLELQFYIWWLNIVSSCSKMKTRHYFRNTWQTHMLWEHQRFFRVMEHKVRLLSSLYSTQGELSASGWDSNASGMLGMEVVRAGAMSHSEQKTPSEIPPSAGPRQQTLQLHALGDQGMLWKCLHFILFYSSVFR